MPKAIISDPEIIIVNTQQSYPLKRGYSLINNFLMYDIATHAKCAGKALCGGCLVKIIAGQKFCNPPVIEEKIKLNAQALEQGWRLACQTQCLKSIQLYLPTEKEIKALLI